MASVRRRARQNAARSCKGLGSHHRCHRNLADLVEADGVHLETAGKQQVSSAILWMLYRTELTYGQQAKSRLPRRDV